MNALTQSKFAWLLRREYWEHKGGFLWAPAIVGAVMSFFVIASLIGGSIFKAKHGIHINGARVQMNEVLTPEQQADFASGLAQGYLGTSAPLFGVLALVVFFFCLASMYDDRKDRSVLFWKSLPISDTATVMSKLAMALLIGPIITLVAATLTAGLIAFSVTLTSALHGVNMFGVLLSTPDLYLGPFKLLAMLPVYIVWAVPTVGWLMLVSAWSRSKPFLWAVGAPVLTGVLITWFNALFDLDWNVEWFWAHIVGRGLLSVSPGSWMPFIEDARGIDFDGHGEHLSQLVSISWQAFSLPSMWIGLVVGAAMIYAAVRLRRYRDEG
ncbi:MAG TPA: hypothetical protein VFY12_02990 [Arenimonas sp.]|nr:hypothetical protein [Arenimonas sp.]